MRGERRTEMRSLHLSLSAFLLEGSKAEMSSKETRAGAIDTDMQQAIRCHTCTHHTSHSIPTYATT